MRRPFRSQIVTGVALVALSGAVPAWSAAVAAPSATAPAPVSAPAHPAMASPTTTPPGQPSPGPSSPGKPSPSQPAGDPSPSPSLSPTKADPEPLPCKGCLNPLDTICWEYVSRCSVALTSAVPLQAGITAHYRTFPITAEPAADYVEVTSGTVVIFPGKLAGDAVVWLLPDPQSMAERTFGVEFFDLPDGMLARSKAIVTIKPEMG